MSYDDCYLPFNNTYGLTYYDSDAELCLKPEIQDWCKENFGYWPELLLEWRISPQQAWLRFKNPIDATLFKVRYSSYWVKSE